jgi:hypothetical protein
VPRTASRKWPEVLPSLDYWDMAWVNY